MDRRELIDGVDDPPSPANFAWYSQSGTMWRELWDDLVLPDLYCFDRFNAVRESQVRSFDEDTKIWLIVTAAKSLIACIEQMRGLCGKEIPLHSWPWTLLTQCTCKCHFILGAIFTPNKCFTLLSNSLGKHLTQSFLGLIIVHFGILTVETKSVFVGLVPTTGTRLYIG